MQDWLCVKCAGAARLYVLADGRRRPYCAKHLVECGQNAIAADCADAVERRRIAERECPTNVVLGAPIFIAPDGSAAPPNQGVCGSKAGSWRFATDVVHAQTTQTCQGCGEAWSVNAIHACAAILNGGNGTGHITEPGVTLFLGPPVKGENAVITRADQFKVGQWVRWVHDGKGLKGCALGQLGLIESLSTELATVSMRHDLKYLLGFAQIEPAAPRDGEWWQSTDCPKHNPSRGAFRVEMGNVQFERNREEQARCSCLVPVDFGFGLGHA